MRRDGEGIALGIGIVGFTSSTSSGIGVILWALKRFGYDLHSARATEADTVAQVFKRAKDRTTPNL